MPEGKGSFNYETPEELVAAGYTQLSNSRCNGATCGAEITWWETPNGKKIPLDPETLKPHWATCPDAGSFRKKK